MVTSSMAAPSHEQADQTAAELDRPLRVLVQTKTHLVPGDKHTSFEQRTGDMKNLICQRVWQRDYDDDRERTWHRGCEFAFDDRECWFLVDHYGPDPVLPADPPVLWLTWTGTEFIIEMQGPLPAALRRRVRQYPFERMAPAELQAVPAASMPTRQYHSQAEEIRIRRGRLMNTLACNLTLFEDHVNFVRQYPEEAEWVRARVPPEAWARLDDPSQICRPVAFLVPVTSQEATEEEHAELLDAPGRAGS